jgi:DNA-binding transcriptional MocR family regulator
MLLGYATPAGPEATRRLLARRLLEQGVEAAPDQLLLTDSSTHSLDLILRFLVEPGDTVVLDEPCYFNFQALMRAHRVKVVGVPMTPAGPDAAVFAQVLAEHRPRLYLTNCAIHNPTGAVLSAPHVHRILKLAEAHDLIIIEDDIFADFEDEPAARYAAFDGLENVIRVGSFSKSISRSARLGYIAARPDWIRGMTDLRIATGISGSALAMELSRFVLSDTGYRRHMEKVRARLAQARHQALGRLRALGIEPWTVPGNGLFLWCRLPDDACATDVAKRGMEENIVYAPGNVFSLGQTCDCYMRFNVAMLNDERIYAHLARTLETAPRLR